MSTSIRVDLRCDGCEYVIAGEVGRPLSIRSARSRAHAEGWRFMRRSDGWHDLCPVCVAKALRSPAEIREVEAARLSAEPSSGSRTDEIVSAIDAVSRG